VDMSRKPAEANSAQRGRRWGPRALAVAVSSVVLLAVATAVNPTAAGAVVQNTRLVLNLFTDDDLRGGNDNVNATLNFRTRAPLVRPNINGGQRWADRTWHQYIVENDPGTGEIELDQVANVVLSDTFSGGIGGDNWNLGALTISFEEFHTDGNINVRLIYSQQSSPLFRFTFTARTFTAFVDAVRDGGFETQRSALVSSPWAVEGTDAKGIDIGRGLAAGGANNAWIRTASRTWNAVTQPVPLRPNTRYFLRGSIRTSSNVNTAFFGVRLPSRSAPVELHLGPTAGGAYQQVQLTVDTGPDTSATVFGGFWGIGVDGWLQLDEVSLKYF
jgi:hypothetical protein